MLINLIVMYDKNKEKKYYDEVNKRFKEKKIRKVKYENKKIKYFITRKYIKKKKKLNM